MALNTNLIWANHAAKAILLIRVLVGWIFLSEGIQKFLFPDSLGEGRFVKIGIPWSQVMAPFVGIVEIVCGTLLLVGFLTRLASVPLLIDIVVALYSTKIVAFAKNGFWGTLHEARTDVTKIPYRPIVATFRTLQRRDSCRRRIFKPANHPKEEFNELRKCRNTLCCT